MSRFSAWVLAVTAVALIVLAGQPAGLQAHADLLRAEPETGSELAESPSVLTLYFSQGLKQQGSFVQVVNAGGDRMPVEVAFDAGDDKVMRATLGSPLAPGVYEVRWQTLSADDDDYHDGSYELTVLNPDGSSPGAGPTPGASDTTDEDGGSDTLILVLVSGAVVLGLGGLVLFLSKSGRKRQ